MNRSQFRISLCESLATPPCPTDNSRETVSGSGESISRFWRLQVLLFVVVFFTFGVAEQAFSQSINDPRWRHFKQEDGLGSNDISSIAVGERGIWFGGNDSVSYFDGTWTFYSPETSSDTEFEAGSDGSSVPATRIAGDIAVIERAQRDQMLWIGTTEGALLLLDSTRNAWYEVTQVDAEVTALSSANDLIWVATVHSLFKVEFVSDHASPVPLVSSVTEVLSDSPVFALLSHQDELYVGHQGGILAFGGDEWGSVDVPLNYHFTNPINPLCSHQTGVARAGSNPDSDENLPPSVHALWVDEENALWIGTPRGAARRVADASTGEYCWTIFPTYTPAGQLALVQALTGDDGSVWAATDGGGALLFDEFGAVTLPYGRAVPGNMNTNFVRDVAIDRDGSVWFSTPVGVFQFLKHTWYMEPGYLETFGSPIGDPNVHNIRDVLLDRRDRLWIATAAGIRLKESPAVEKVRYTLDNSNLPSNNVLSLAEDSEGGIWAGTEGAGVARYVSGGWTTPISVDQLPSSAVTNLLADQSGHVWIGTDSGLVLYSLSDGQTTWIGELNGKTIKALAFDSSERLWIASTHVDENAEKMALIWQYGPDEQGSIRIFHQAIKEITGISALPAEFELSLAADYSVANGMWLAVDRIGLFRWNGEVWRDGDPTRQLPTDFLWTLYAEPDTSNLWVGNEGGVTLFDGRTWGTLKEQDGLRSPAIWAITGSANEGYWFGGLTGLSYYRPDGTPPWVRLEQVVGDEIAVESPDSLSALEGETVKLTLAYGDLQTPKEKIKLYYRQTAADSFTTHDVDVPWLEVIEPFTLDTAQPRTTRFEFQARDQAFNYSPVFSLAFSVRPASVVDLSLLGLGEVEQTTFLTLITLAVLALLGFGYVSMEIIQGRRRAQEAIARSYNPYVSGEPIRRDDMFFGRHSLLQRIIDTLHNNSIMIHGERRIGKTTMLYQIVNRLEDVDDPAYWFLPIYVDLEGTTQEQFFHFLIEEIVHRVCTVYDGELASSLNLSELHFHSATYTAYTDREFSRDLRKVVRQLQAHGEVYYPARHLRVILMLDEMDVMSSYDHLIQQQLRRIFMRDFAATLGAVVAGIQISKDWERIESPWYNMFNEIEIEPFTREQAIELLVEPVKDYYSFEPEALEYIIDHSDGRPFRIQQYGLEVVTNMLAAGRRRITLEDVKIAHENIENSYAHTHSDAGLQPGSFQVAEKIV